MFDSTCKFLAESFSSDFAAWLLGESTPLTQLNRRIGNIPSEIEAKIQSLSLEQLEALGEALLDFTSLADLES